MKNRNGLRRGLATVFAVGGVLAAVGGWTAARRTATPAPAPQATGMTAAAAVYRVVGVWEGKLAVFLPDAATPERVYETRVSALPEEEQARLMRGIVAENRRELLALLENYSG